MIIKILLLAGIGVCFAYFYLGRIRSLFLRTMIYLMLAASAVLVIAPELATALANALGVGRGADLVIYIWMLVSFAMIANLHVKARETNRALSAIVREIAILSPTGPGSGRGEAQRDPEVGE